MPLAALWRGPHREGRVSCQPPHGRVWECILQPNSSHLGLQPRPSVGLQPQETPEPEPLGEATPRFLTSETGDNKCSWFKAATF